MKKIIALSSAVLLLAGSVQAATKQEKAQELLNLMNMQATFDAAYTQSIIPVTCTLTMPASAEEELKTEFMQIADMPKVMQNLSQFWIQNYTDQELDQLIAFYKTGVGKKSIELMPQFTQFSMTEMQKWGQEKGPAFIALGKKMAQKYPARTEAEAKACIKSKLGL